MLARPSIAKTGAFLALVGLVACETGGPYLLGRWPGDDVSAGTGGGAATGGSTTGPGGDSNDDPVAPCEAPRAAHRYPLTGSGTEIVDDEGGASGTVHGGAALGGGELVLDGVDDFVKLPVDAIDGADEFSVAIWIRHRGISAYQRLFDFGAGSVGPDAAPDLSSVGTSYFVLTPRTGFVPDELALLVTTSGAPNEVAAVTNEELTGELEFLVATFETGLLRLHRNGNLVARVPHSLDRSQLVVEDAWLGRSHYSADPYAETTYLEVAIFHVALEDCAVQSSFEAGPL